MSEENAPKKSESTSVLVGILILVALGALMILSECNPQSLMRNPEEATSVAPSPPSWQPPEGFTPVPPGRSNVDTAYKFTDRKDLDCGFMQTCVGIEFVNSTTCQTFYAAISLTDKTGANIGFTNDLTQNVAAGQIAKLTFGVKPPIEGLEISEVKCL